MHGVLRYSSAVKLNLTILHCLYNKKIAYLTNTLYNDLRKLMSGGMADEKDIVKQ